MSFVFRLGQFILCPISFTKQVRWQRGIESSATKNGKQEAVPRRLGRIVGVQGVDARHSYHLRQSSPYPDRECEPRTQDHLTPALWSRGTCPPLNISDGRPRSRGGVEQLDKSVLPETTLGPTTTTPTLANPAGVPSSPLAALQSRYHTRPPRRIKVVLSLEFLQVVFGTVYSPGTGTYVRLKPVMRSSSRPLHRSTAGHGVLLPNGKVLHA